ncbi:uncharacterized protein LOC126293682 isoform X1 [Schistocerca gregaria]|uniref:uncharacterized protein LOC126293682 isoform X1 n=1 Tax=Schistocerca gregaria TaxID=7010 RepID=UPI00211DD2C3|nr:uncharacterized protein LOC126293682 isoform X1 [Schistocerca gregaria]
MRRFGHSRRWKPPPPRRGRRHQSRVAPTPRTKTPDRGQIPHRKPTLQQPSTHLYLATGDSYTTISFSYRVGISTVSSIVNQVCDALWRTMQPLYMPTATEDFWRNVAAGFHDRWNFPHCIGAIDGKHVRIQAPPASGSSFYNYKKYYSTVLLGLVDANCKFITVDVGSYGKECDSIIFSNSTLGKRLSTYSLGVPKDEPLVPGGSPVPYVIVGDEGFPLQRYMIRPYPRRNLNDEKRVYNYRVSRCRRVVENVFGIVAQRWRLYFRPLQCNLDTVHKVIKATVILHNYLCNKCDVTTVGSPEEILVAYSTCWKSLEKTAAAATKENAAIRNHFVNFFNSPEGSVPWQWRHIANT